MKSMLAVFVVIALSILVFTYQPSRGQSLSPVPSGNPATTPSLSALPVPDQGVFQPPVNNSGQPKGWVILYYLREQGDPPLWVDTALLSSFAQLEQNKGKLNLISPSTELTLVSAQADDLGITHLLFEQVYNSVPVFGGRLMLHLAANGLLLSYEARNVPGIDGHIYRDARQVDTNPTLGPTQAIEAAKTALGYTGTFAKAPEANLVILPHKIRNSGPSDETGATLVYRVELLVEDGTPATARHWYFVDAHDGKIVWYFDAMNKGTGQSLYSGIVSFPTGYSALFTSHYDSVCGGYVIDNGYWLWDSSGNYGYMQATDMRNLTNNDISPQWTGHADAHEYDDRWGIFYTPAYCQPILDRDPPMIDVQFGMALTWDYFLTFHGRRGIDNMGYRMFGRAHYGVNLNYAAWNGTNISFGDGSSGAPWVAIDIVAHEWTHGINEKTAGLYSANEAGASNESFADIFGTMVEFLANNPISPPDYLIAEDIGYPQRSLANPPAYSDPDHYNNRRYPGYCTPTTGFFGNDNCGIYDNTGIQNKAFYLLAEGGTHPYSGIHVTGIGREAAARIFYRALTFHLVGTPNASFHEVRIQTGNAASALYGFYSNQRAAVGQAWSAVGVPANEIDEAWRFVRQSYMDVLGRVPDQGGWQNWANHINSCGPSNSPCIQSRRIETARGFLESPEFRRNKPALSNPGTPEYNQEYVRQCYRTFLQREPDAGGYNDWLNFINSTGDYNTLVYGFIYSDQYRRRFCCGG